MLSGQRCQNCWQQTLPHHNAATCPFPVVCPESRVERLIRAHPNLRKAWDKYFGLHKRYHDGTHGEYGKERDNSSDNSDFEPPGDKNYSSENTDSSVERRAKKYGPLQKVTNSGLRLFGREDDERIRNYKDRKKTATPAVDDGAIVYTEEMTWANLEKMNQEAAKAEEEAKKAKEKKKKGNKGAKDQNRDKQEDEKPKVDTRALDESMKEYYHPKLAWGNQKKLYGSIRELDARGRLVRQIGGKDKEQEQQALGGGNKSKSKRRSRTKSRNRKRKKKRKKRKMRRRRALDRADYRSDTDSTSSSSSDSGEKKDSARKVARGHQSGTRDRDAGRRRAVDKRKRQESLFDENDSEDVGKRKKKKDKTKRRKSDKNQSKTHRCGSGSGERERGRLGKKSRKADRERDQSVQKKKKKQKNSGREVDETGNRVDKSCSSENDLAQEQEEDQDVESELMDAPGDVTRRNIKCKISDQEAAPISPGSKMKAFLEANEDGSSAEQDRSPRNPRTSTTS
ncbi:unnamed protein product, partial [Amoebophrya sp. A120]|eukprot:GSA120T00014266001.1